MSVIDELDNQDFSMEDHLKNSGVASVPWSEEHETILVVWADKAMCYRWLHKSVKIYSYEYMVYSTCYYNVYFNRYC